MIQGEETKTSEIHANWQVFFEDLHTAGWNAAHTVPCLHNTSMPFSMLHYIGPFYLHSLTCRAGEVSTGCKIEITDQKLCSIPTFCDFQRNLTWWWFWDKNLVCNNRQTAVLQNKGYAIMPIKCSYNYNFLYVWTAQEMRMMSLLATRQLLRSNRLRKTLNWNCMWWEARCSTHSSGLSLQGCDWWSYVMREIQKLKGSLKMIWHVSVYQ